VPTSPADALRRAGAASRVGPRVPEGDFAFRVHGVFPSAMNLALDGRRGLVTLVGEDGEGHPSAIHVASAVPFDAWDAPPGTGGRRAGARLEFDGAAGGEPFVVDLAGARREPCVVLPRLDPAAVPLREAWASCAFHLDGLQAEKASDLRLAALCGTAEPESALGRRLCDAARTLAGAVRACDAPAGTLAASRLLGLGAGLTPAGDDFLCGLLAALECTSAERGADGRFLRTWSRSLEDRLGATTAVSATFLENAIAGCFPQALAAFAASLAGGSAFTPGGPPRTALDRLCALGHSSGMDTATGFLFGLWLRQDDESRHHAASL